MNIESLLQDKENVNGMEFKETSKSPEQIFGDYKGKFLTVKQRILPK